MKKESAVKRVGVGRGGLQWARHSEFPGDRVGRPGEKVVFDPNFPYIKPKATRLVKEIFHSQAEVCFPKKTVIYPINPVNGRPWGSRILLNDLDANRVYGEGGKQRKVKNLSLWEAIGEAGIWNGKLRKRFIIYPGDQFTAYSKNARKNKNKKE